MQGYILNTKKSGENNLIIDILTHKSIIKTMRFYGVRHSSMMIGNKIDFELSYNQNYLPILKESIHLGFMWQNDLDKLTVFLNFIKLLSKYLKDVKECDSYYYEILEQITSRLMFQDAQRVVVDAYVKMLHLEGRLHNINICYVCDSDLLDNNIHLSSGLLPLCNKCHELSFKQNNTLFLKSELSDLISNFNSSLLDDDKIEAIYQIINFGL